MTTPDLRPSSRRVDLAACGVPDAPTAADDGTGAAPFLCDVEIDESSLSATIPHVNNVVYLSWIDRAAELHGDAVGQTRAALFDRGIMWFVARHDIEYRAEVFGEDDVVVATWLTEMSRTTAQRATAIVRPADATLVCRATTRWALVDLASRRPLRIPGDMRPTLESMGAVASATSPTAPKVTSAAPPGRSAG